ncbi:hypothetical protein SK128_021272 [Halocaridina rubra]|uniref:AWS domain-containing protein n=1 Tax=Halocaridina rubra TaxID=373956 RepID=A0AAN8WZN1_HALRR
MNGEMGDNNTPVRRSSRARKPNSRFADDELEGCIKKIVKGVSSSEATSSARLKKSSRAKRESISEEAAGSEVSTEEKLAKTSDETTDVSPQDEINIKETTNITEVALADPILVPDTQPEVLNGLLDDRENLQSNISKPKSSLRRGQERRTQSTSKRVDLESISKEDKKSGGRKGGKTNIAVENVEAKQNESKSDNYSGKLTLFHEVPKDHLPDVHDATVSTDPYATSKKATISHHLVEDQKMGFELNPAENSSVMNYSIVQSPRSCNQHEVEVTKMKSKDKSEEEKLPTQNLSTEENDIIRMKRKDREDEKDPFKDDVDIKMSRKTSQLVKKGTKINVLKIIKLTPSAGSTSFGGCHDKRNIVLEKKDDAAGVIAKDSYSISETRRNISQKPAESMQISDIFKSAVQKLEMESHDNQSLESANDPRFVSEGAKSGNEEFDPFNTSSGEQKRKRRDELEDDKGTKKKKKNEDSLLSTTALDGNDMEEDRTNKNASDAAPKITLSFSEKTDKTLKTTTAPIFTEAEEEVKRSKPLLSHELNPRPVDNETREATADQSNDDVEDRRLSSLGSILSLLKSPDVAKKIVENTESRTKLFDSQSLDADRRSDKKRRDSEGKWRTGDYDSARKDDHKWKLLDEDRTSGYKRDERKWKAVSESAKRDQGQSSHEDDSSKKNKFERPVWRSGHEKTASTSGSIKDDKSDVMAPYDWGTGDVSWSSIKDVGDNMDWSSQKDKLGNEASHTPASDISDVKENILKKEPFKVISEAGPKASAYEEENTDADDRRSSSIGNILSFLKRSGCPPAKPMHGDPPSSSNGNRDYANSTKEENSKWVEGEPIRRKPRVSRWSARESSDDVPSNNLDSLSVPSSENKSASGEQYDSGTHCYDKWESVPQQPIQVLVSSDKGSSMHGYTSKDRDFRGSHSRSRWNNPNVGWKSWNEGQNKNSFEGTHGRRGSDSNKYYERTRDKDAVSDEENTNAVKREGLSEFIESLGGEFVKPAYGTGGNSPERQRLSGYPSCVPPLPPPRRASWSPKNEKSLSPNREIYSSPRNRDYNSPLRDAQSWSPRSSEIVLSPKSRELMSSLRNMEVKLTPQMQDLASQETVDDSVQPENLSQYPPKPVNSYGTKESDILDVFNIPLPPGSGDLSAYHKIPPSESLGLPQGGSSSKPKDISEDRKTFETLWKSSEDRYKTLYGNKFETVKREQLEEGTPVKLEQGGGKGGLSVTIHDKENLEPAVKKEEKLTTAEIEGKNLQSKEERNKLIVQERMKSFLQIKDNLYLGDRKKSKRSKEVRRMVCDCSLTKEEMVRGEVGCGEDCLNRLLMIECGSRCSLKDRCANKRFQNCSYADVEVFNADEKGCGVRAHSAIPS